MELHVVHALSDDKVKQIQVANMWQVLKEQCLLKRGLLKVKYVYDNKGKRSARN